MARTLADAKTKVRNKIKDLATTAEVTDTELDHHLGSAVERYSKDRPRQVPHEFAGDGASYDFALPNDWEDDFSRLLGGLNSKVEYPASERVPLFIEDADWTIYDLVVPKKLRLLAHTPGATEKVRYLYSKRHVLDAQEVNTTIPSVDFDALCDLTAGFSLDALAAKYARSTDPTIGADTVNYRDGQLKCKQQAEIFKKRYFLHVGVKEDGVAAASADADFDSSPGWAASYGGYLTHSHRRR